jgi:hypothetical protein
VDRIGLRSATGRFTRWTCHLPCSQSDNHRRLLSKTVEQRHLYQNLGIGLCNMQRVHASQRVTIYQIWISNPVKHAEVEFRKWLLFVPHPERWNSR